MKKTIRLLMVLFALGMTSGGAQGAFVEVTDRKALAALTQAVRAFRFQCPRAAVAIAKGPGPRGAVFKVFCGPPGGGVYQRLVYRVVMTPDDRFFVAPWD